MPGRSLFAYVIHLEESRIRRQSRAFCASSMKLLHVAATTQLPRRIFLRSEKRSSSENRLENVAKWIATSACITMSHTRREYYLINDIETEFLCELFVSFDKKVSQRDSFSWEAINLIDD